MVRLGGINHRDTFRNTLFLLLKQLKCVQDSKELFRTVVIRIINMNIKVASYSWTVKVSGAARQ